VYNGRSSTAAGSRSGLSLATASGGVGGCEGGFGNGAFGVIAVTPGGRERPASTAPCNRTKVSLGHYAIVG